MVAERYFISEVHLGGEASPELRLTDRRVLDRETIYCLKEPKVKV